MTEQELLNMLAQPSQRERAFRQLVNQYGDRLYQHLNRMLSNHEDASDVLQNTFVKVYRSVDRFQGKSKLYTWMYRIATNEALTFLDKQKRKLSVFATVDNEDRQLYNRAAETEVDGNYIQLRLQQAMEQLPPKQKAVFSMRYFEEKSYQEMSEIFTTSVGALKASYHHAVKKMEVILKN